MSKYILKFAVIIVLNLFAFLIIGNILDGIFGTGKMFLVICLVFSILPLILIILFQVKKIQTEIDLNIKKQNSNDGK